jgi:sterol desaturase/sphingolipid hydroxylase (fatty acid hydroxylase superfamily)
MVEALADYLESGIALLAFDLASPWSRSGLIAIALGWVIGAFAFRHYFGREGFSLGAYLRQAFPRRVYWSRSFAVDLQVFLFGRLVAPMRWVALVLSVMATAAILADGLAGLFGPARTTPLGPYETVLLAVLLLLALDFGTYVSHRLSHQVPLLWAFHRLHHSAEELNPLTLERKHPAYSLLSLIIDCIVVAPLQAVILYLFGSEASLAVLTGANLGFVAFAYCAASLRHTHIWLSYGPVLNRVLVSPALHQIHHSKAPRHFNRNYGEVLSIWDWMFGSLYLPREREELEFGLGDEDEQPHPNLGAALLEPFAYAWRTMRRPSQRGPAAPSLPDSQP